MEKLKNSIKGIYRYFSDGGRMGDVDALFIANEIEVAEIIGKTVYFGEILGKHSEVTCDIEESELTLVSDDQEFIKKFISIMGDGTISGHNPIEYYNEQEM